MRKLVLLIAAAAAMSSMAISPASAGCYRMGLSGYHWYRHCAGPRVLYPHRRHCNSHGYCWYH